jgi:hypothetical protein
MKTCGHVVLEKADVRGIPTALAVCGDLDTGSGEKTEPVSGALKGRLASAFAQNFVSGVSEYGEDYLQAAVFGLSVSPAGEAPLFGPGAEFGSGCAGILAAGRSAYIYVTEGSGMCILRYAEVFGKRKLIRCLSSEEGGEDVVGLQTGSLLIACPEKWTEEQSLSEMMSLFNPEDIRDDDAFDRHLRELAEEGFEGCITALLVR